MCQTPQPGHAADHAGHRAGVEITLPDGSDPPRADISALSVHRAVPAGSRDGWRGAGIQIFASECSGLQFRGIPTPWNLHQSLIFQLTSARRATPLPLWRVAAARGARAEQVGNDRAERTA